MYRPILIALAVTFVQFEASQAQQQTSPPDAAQFAQQASQTILFDIEAARLATVRAKDAETSTFAQQILNDQLKAQADLKRAAQEEGVAVATALDGEHQRKLQSLEKLPGESFDAAFVSTQTQAHRSALKLLSDYGARGEREALRAYAQSSYSTTKVNFARVQPGGTP